MAGAGPEGRAVFEAFLRAGQPVMLDLASPAADRLPEPDLWAWLASDRLAFMPTRFGLRLTPDQALRPEAGPALRRAGSLVLVADRLPRGFGENLRAWRARGMRLLWEYAPMAESLPEAALWDGILVRGVESGGRSRDYSVRVLFEHARRRLPPGLPIHVQGVEAPELAAVFIALGAAGVMADAGLVRLPAAGLADGERRALRAPLETCLRRRPDSDDWAEIAYTLPAAEPARNLAAGPGLFLAEAGAPEEPSAWMSAFRQRTASVLARLMDLAPEDLAAGVGDPAWIQGPMAFLSCSAPFARACREAGFFPVFSFTALAETEASALRDAVAGAEGIGAYGLGFAGPPAFDVPGLVRSLAARPPAALVLAADQWPRRQEFASLGIPLWLHVQKPEHARFALEQGVTTWIVEGNESGGHVGYLPGTVLWTLLLKTAAALDRPDLRVILAGGIVDEASVLFGLLLGRACGFRGRLSFQLGTALAAAPEAAAAGVVHPAYQRRLRQARRTRVLGPDTGAGLRAATDGAARPVPAAPSGPPEPGVALQAIASYRAALAGSEHDLVLAGEGVLALDRPLPLAELAGRLAAYAEAWRDCRGRLRPVETLDFRVARPLPALDLAIVGAGGLFPGAPDLRAFWDNLAANRRCIGEIPPDYWGAGEYHTPDPDAACRREARLTYTRSAGRLDFFRFDALDCLKFHLSPRAAEVADKIQLVLLKALDQALESAGPSLRLPADRTAVVVANSMGGETTRRGALRTHLADLLAVLARAPELAGLAPEQRDRLASRLLEELGAAAPPVTEDSMVGGSPSILAGRLAGFLGLRGGNYAVDAACAASLVGLATAVALIRSGQAEAAVLGGVDCELSVDAFISFCKLRALSRTISRPYMEDSDGFTMGEGGGVLLLKPFEQALRDGDPVLARIVGVGLSSDGRQGSLTLPQAEGQELAIRRCFDMSGFDPRSIRYIEGHGTGTAAGDAVELEVLGRVFAEAGPGRVILGTVKSLIGHLKSAAGMASLIKTALALHRRLLPPAWIEGTPHPVLRAPGCPLRLLAAPEPWRRDGFLPRRAAVSAFGFGGSNAHVHLEEMDETFRFLTAARLLLFSGADRAEVARRVADLAAAVEAAGFLDYADPRQLACLGGAGPCRLAMVWDTARPWPEARAALARALAGGDAGPDVWAADQVRPRPMVWLFPGQGVAAKPSFRQPAATVPLFADAVRAAEAHAGVPLFDTLWPGDRAPVELLFQARQPERQPAMVALSLALARVCRCLGLWPDAVAGHSLGFYSALAAAGALSEADALRLVRRRADCFAALGPDHAGCLVALAVDETAARTLAAESPVPAHVANMNSPRQTVLALRQSDADRFKAFLEARGVEYRLVPVGWAFHSPLVAPAAERFRAHLADAAFRRPAVAIYTERAGARIPAESFDGRFPDWLPAHLMDSIRFDRLVRTLAEDGFEVFLEIGAGGTLTRLVRDNLPPESVLALTLDSTAEDVVAHWHRVWARLYVEAGRDFDLGGYAEVLAGQLRPVRTGASAAAAVRPAGPAPVEIALPPAGAASAAAGDRRRRNARGQCLVGRTCGTLDG
jgi:acyl transferase domain-containing protein